MEQVVIGAIHDKRLLEFTYQGKHRLVEPHVLGVTNGVRQVLTYQIGGHSSRGLLPDWRRFDLHEMGGLSVINEHFPGARPTPSGRHSAFDHRIAVVR